MALGMALIGALAVAGGHDLPARAGQPERSANSLFGSAPGDPFGTAAPPGSARGSAVPGEAAHEPTPRDGPTPAAQGTPQPPPETAAEDATTAPGGSSSEPLYLTFDDGPDPTWTPKVLAVLQRYGVPATFFELGVQVKDHPSLPALVRSHGHAIGNHTFSHQSLPGLSGQQLRREIERGPAATCLRPPFGAVNGRVRAAAAAAGQRIVLWDVDTRDWSKPGTSHIVQAVLKGAQPGATILMHDAGGDRAETVAALRIVLPRLIQQGYTFATVPGC
jgi:peptidoglycan/xylan/chitin deacetylase (PgdA/CDA1 family)